MEIEVPLLEGLVECKQHLQLSLLLSELLGILEDSAKHDVL